MNSNNDGLSIQNEESAPSLNATSWMNHPLPKVERVVSELPYEVSIAELRQSSHAMINKRTKEKYIDTLRSINNKLRSAVQDGKLLQPMVTYLYNENNPLRYTTKNYYRGVIKWFAEYLYERNQCEDVAGALRALNEHKKFERPKNAPRSTRTKVVPESDVEKILEALFTQSRINASTVLLIAWIKATLVAGARPNEWMDAQIITVEQFKEEQPDKEERPLDVTTHTVSDAGDNQPAPQFKEIVSYLKLRNSKAKADKPRFMGHRPIDKARAKERGLDEGEDYFDINDPQGIGFVTDLVYIPKAPAFRYIALSQEAHDQVGEFLEILMEHYHTHGAYTSDKWSDAFALAYEVSRKLLRRVVLEVFGGKKNYTLYSLRGQFNANVIALYGREAMFDLMGHSRADTAARSFYGKAVSAHKKFKGMKQDNADRRINKWVEKLTSNALSSHAASSNGNQSMPENNSESMRGNIDLRLGSEGLVITPELHGAREMQHAKEKTHSDHDVVPNKNAQDTP